MSLIKKEFRELVFGYIAIVHVYLDEADFDFFVMVLDLSCYFCGCLYKFSYFCVFFVIWEIIFIVLLCFR